MKMTIIVSLKLALSSLLVTFVIADDAIVANVTNAQGCASEPYVLPEPFKVGTTTVTSIYLCHDGYITVAGQSSNLENPDDLLDPPTTVIAGGLIGSNDTGSAFLKTFDNINYFASAVPCFTYKFEIGALWVVDNGNRGVFVACGIDDMGVKRCLFEVDVDSLGQITDDGQYMRFGINGPESKSSLKCFDFHLLYYGQSNFLIYFFSLSNVMTPSDFTPRMRCPTQSSSDQTIQTKIGSDQTDLSRALGCQADLNCALGEPDRLELRTRAARPI